MLVPQHMAMGQGEQRTLYPFFGKDLGVSTGPTPQSSPPIRQNPLAITNNTSRDNLQDAQSTPFPKPIDPQVTTLDEDPNINRRKRRKTKEADEVPSEESHGVSQGNSSNATPTQGATDGSSLTGHVDCGGNVQEEKPSKQKTLKLNPNGKLLSSPTSNRVEGNTQKRTGSKRNKSKPNAKETRVVILKYGHNKEKVGKLIDDIVNGRLKHDAHDRPATPVKVEKQPPKATHPFFLKKSSQISATPPSRQSVPYPESAEVSKADTGQKPAALGQASNPLKPLGTFKQRVSRYPELIEPLWPPQDFVHVRGAGTGRKGQVADASDPLTLDQKKAKVAVIRIGDNENVLLSSMRRTRSSVTGKCRSSPGAMAQGVLRIPGRHIASGRVLRKAMLNQLSDPVSKYCTDPSLSRKTIHAAVAHLDSSISNYSSSFDRGEFDTLLWTQKYAPNNAAEVLQAGPEAIMLRDWLKYLMVSAVDTGKSAKDGETTKSKTDPGKRTKRRKKSEKLDGFIVSSGDEASEMDEVNDSEDELAGGVTVSSKRTVVRSGDMAMGAKIGTERGRMTNAILLSGPPGCGKTASVYAVAKELDFEVFEINAGSRRSAKDIIERVGDMTQNHLVEVRSRSSDHDVQDNRLEDAKQDKVMSFFKPQSSVTTKKGKTSRKGPASECNSKRSNQKQSLILLEEADILFEEDKQFWSGVMTLISQSKRAIIITCNDETRIPLEDISFHAILRYRSPPQDLVVDYLLYIAAHEGHMLKRDAISDLYSASNKDLRKSIMDLNFWCQMGVGSEKSGLDWILDRWPRGSDVDQHGDKLRVLSLNTYQRFMGWFNRDMVLASSPLDREAELTLESLHWWQLSIQDSESIAGSSGSNLVHSKSHTSEARSKGTLFDALRQESDYADMRSALDLLCSGCALDLKEDPVDVAVSPMTESQRASYIEGYPLLHADLKPDHSSLSATMGTAFDAMISTAFRPDKEPDNELLQAARVLANLRKAQTVNLSMAGLLAAFEPIMRANYLMPIMTGRLAPSFENGLAPITEDLAPYIRSIMNFDLRLEQYRLQLSGLLSKGASGTKRLRKTRASRAALEGGDKASTRKERWFSSEVNPSRILATGDRTWQDILVQSGHFNVVPFQDPVKEQCVNNVSDSSGDGGF